MSRWVVVCAALFFAACSVDPAERPEPQIQTEAATRATVGEDGHTYERWYTVYDNWIEFYSDPQRTNRIALPDALRVFEIVRVENSNGVGPYQKLYISPGTWQYTLHDSVEDAEFSYGDTTYFTYLSYSNLRIVSDNI